MMFSSLPTDTLVMTGVFLLAIISTFKVVRHLLSFMHLLAAQTRLGTLEFIDHVAYNTLRELGEVRKIEQIPTVAFGFLFWSMVWVMNLYAFIMYVLIYMR